ncbi:MAG: hypothetical protein HY010_10580 [Acidobacteria bacterium]|nr:hypothetical protein [Acidobacteriota bacterium]
MKQPGLDEVAGVLFVMWLILLLPCLLLAPISLMAFDAGQTPKANAFVWSIWTYPVAVVIVAIFRKKAPVIALLPFVNVVTCVLAGL